MLIWFMSRCYQLLPSVNGNLSSDSFNKGFCLELDWHVTYVEGYFMSLFHHFSVIFADSLCQMSINDRK